MTDEQTKENSYVYQIALHMKETVERLEKKLDDNTAKTELVLLQATKTNGRVNGLEQWSSETKLLIENMARATEGNKDKVKEVKEQSDTEIKLLRQDHKSDKTQVIIAVSIIAFFVAGFGTMGYILIKKDLHDYTKEVIEQQQDSFIKKTADMVVTAIEDKYDLKVQ